MMQRVGLTAQLQSSQAVDGDDDDAGVGVRCVVGVTERPFERDGERVESEEEPKTAAALA